MKFSDIQPLTKSGTYNTNVPWNVLETELDMLHQYGLQLCPEFQRGHVWTPQQKTAYVEFRLRGGKSGEKIYFNFPSWYKDVPNGAYNDFVCVDGLQRLTAVRDFLADRVPAFGYLYSEYEDALPTRIDFVFNINDLKSEVNVLKWYLDINAGGTPHAEEEIERVKSILAQKERLL